MIWPYGVTLRSPMPYRVAHAATSSGVEARAAAAISWMMFSIAAIALRAAEAAERRVRREVREADVAGDLDVRKEVGVVGVEHRALHHGERQIGRAPPLE